MRRFLAAFLALGSAAAGAQVVQGPPAGSEFTMRCSGSESRWVVAKNEGGVIRVHRAGDPDVYRQGPVWAYMLGDIYDELGLGAGAGMNRMVLLKGPAEGPKDLVAGSKTRLTYKWSSPKTEAERSHVLTVQGVKKVRTKAFGEQEVVEVTDDISSPLHDLRRRVQYSPALKMFVTFSIRNNRSKFEQECELASLKSK